MYDKSDNPYILEKRKAVDTAKEQLDLVFDETRDFAVTEGKRVGKIMAGGTGLFTIGIIALKILSKSNNITKKDNKTAGNSHIPLKIIGGIIGTTVGKILMQRAARIIGDILKQRLEDKFL